MKEDFCFCCTYDPPFAIENNVIGYNMKVGEEEPLGLDIVKWVSISQSGKSKFEFLPTEISYLISVF